MSKSRDSMNKVTPITVTAFPGHGPNHPIKISYYDTRFIGSGSFGVVFQARLHPSGEIVAIKKVVQDKRYRNRELGIMRELNHCNILKLKYFYYCEGEKKRQCLDLVLEYFPVSLFDLLKQFNKRKQSMPIINVKLYMYQLFRSLAYLHSLGISHRDIKPHNLLINTETEVLKLCDFGSAKHLVKGETNVSYICSRFYRAPELLFNAVEYTTMVDVWSAGCVLAELILGHAIFLSDDCVSQLVEIMKVLGTPSKEEIRQMNKVFAEHPFPHLDPLPWQEVFKSKASPEVIEIVSRLLVYTPSARLTPLQACAHKFFDALREPNVKLLNNKKLPPLFNFTEHELSIQPNLNSILIPPHLRNNFCAANDDSGSVIPELSSTTADSSTFPTDSLPKISVTL